jgi:hypothetical protein
MQLVQHVQMVPEAAGWSVFVPGLRSTRHHGR